MSSGSGFTAYAEEKSTCRLKTLARPLGQKTDIQFRPLANTEVLYES
jgi:hypothetical protein